MGLKKHLLSHTKGNIKKRTQEADVAWTLDGTSSKQAVSDTPKLTSTPPQSTNTTTPNTETTATQQKLFQETSPTSTCSLADSLARAFQSLVSGKGCQERILEALYSLRFGELPEINDLAHYCLKMCLDCSRPRRVRTFKPSFDHWMKSGMMSNGIALTLKTSEYPRIGKECSLSDILEDKVDKKYFLSGKSYNRLIRRGMSAVYQEQSQQKIKVDKLNGTGVQH